MVSITFLGAKQCGSYRVLQVVRDFRLCRGVAIQFPAIFLELLSIFLCKQRLQIQQTTNLESVLPSYRPKVAKSGETLQEKSHQLRKAAFLSIQLSVFIRGVQCVCLECWSGRNRLCSTLTSRYISKIGIALFSSVTSRTLPQNTRGKCHKAILSILNN